MVLFYFIFFIYLEENKVGSAFRKVSKLRVFLFHLDIETLLLELSIVHIGVDLISCSNDDGPHCKGLFWIDGNGRRLSNWFLANI